jgi:S1-C subfamily serine protease
MKKNRWMTLLLVGMGVVTAALVGVAIYLFASGAGWLTRSEGEMRVFVQAPTRSEVGKEIQLIITVQNDSGEYLQVNEIRLPNRLLESADVASVLPGTLFNHVYESSIGYRIGFLMAPGDQREFVVTLIPRQTDDVIGNVEVLADRYQANSGFRLVFEKPIALAPTSTLTSPPRPTALPTITPVPPTPSPTPVLMPYNSVVKVIAKLKYSSYLKDAWSGSGVIVSPEGLILTNAHLVTPGQGFRPDVLVISLTEDPVIPPTDMYLAEPVVVDEDLDLAVLHIISDLKRKPVDLATLNLPAIPLGDSNQLQLGDTLTILGYPGIGGDTITLTRGDVGGFTAAEEYGERAFIKSTAAISGGTSGGLALNQRGEFIAVPTQLGYGDNNQAELVDCRVIADTNGDGDIDFKDVCVPVGGFINALRPINLAKPLIEQAIAILTYSAPPYPYPFPSP